ncbi:MAG: metalloregulator ArsR/SmtB family transcription factor [Actinomycetota bacterium]
MPDTETRAVLFHGLADPRRLHLIEALAGGPHRVNDLATATGLPQPSVSKHLSCLWDCGLVEREQRGREVYYRLAPGLAALLRATDPILLRSGDRIRACQRYGRLVTISEAA